MYYVYILKSQKTDRYYIGYCTDIQKRIQEHNIGKTKSTKYGRPWDLVYFEKYHTRTKAIQREREIKKRKSNLEL